MDIGTGIEVGALMTRNGTPDIVVVYPTRPGGTKVKGIVVGAETTKSEIEMESVVGFLMTRNGTSDIVVVLPMRPGGTRPSGRVVGEGTMNWEIITGTESTKPVGRLVGANAEGEVAGGMVLGEMPKIEPIMTPMPGGEVLGSMTTQAWAGIDAGVLGKIAGGVTLRVDVGLWVVDCSPGVDSTSTVNPPWGVERTIAVTETVWSVRLTKVAPSVSTWAKIGHSMSWE